MPDNSNNFKLEENRVKSGMFAQIYWLDGTAEKAKCLEKGFKGTRWFRYNDKPKETAEELLKLKILKLKPKIQAAMLYNYPECNLIEKII